MFDAHGLCVCVCVNVCVVNLCLCVCMCVCLGVHMLVCAFGKLQRICIWSQWREWTRSDPNQTQNPPEPRQSKHTQAWPKPSPRRTHLLSQSANKMIGYSAWVGQTTRTAQIWEKLAACNSIRPPSPRLGFTWKLKAVIQAWWGFQGEWINSNLSWTPHPTGLWWGGFNMNHTTEMQATIRMAHFPAAYQQFFYGNGARGAHQAPLLKYKIVKRRVRDAQGALLLTHWKPYIKK